MPGSFRSVPVSIDVSISDLSKGIFEIDGLLSFEDNELLLEYRTTQFMRRSDNGPRLKSCRIKLSDLQDVDYREKVFSTIMTFSPRRLTSIEGVPGDHSAGLTLHVKRKNRHKAAELISEIQLAFARNRHDITGSIPFIMPTASRQFTEIGGLLYTEDEFLVFELQSGITGGSRKKDQIVKIEKKAIRYISLRESLLRDVLSIQPKRHQLLNVIPGDHVDSIKLKINNSYRSEVESLIHDVLTAGDEDNGDIDDP